MITGAAQGAGAVTAELFAAHGASVILADVKDQQGQAMADIIGGSALYQHLDVTNELDWSNAMELAEQAFSGLDILVNNAAILLLSELSTTRRDQFLDVVAVNQLGPFLGIKAAIEPMKRRGGGSIVNISSTDGVKGMNGVAAYASSKWGVRGLTKSAAMELGKYSIRVNTVCPEAGNPNMSAPFIPGQPDLSDIPHQMMQAILKSPENAEPKSRLSDVANMTLFLASDESMSCTGGDFVVDAGLTAGQVQKGAPGS